MRFNPVRLSIARQRRLLNKKGFADLLGVSPHTATRWEQGSTIPSPEMVAAIAAALEFPIAFFYGGNLDIPKLQMVSFRSQKAMTAAVRDAALSAGAIGFLISNWVEERFDLPAPQVPDLSLQEPDVAATTLRQSWSLGHEPVSNMVHLLEFEGRSRVLSCGEL